MSTVVQLSTALGADLLQALVEEHESTRRRSSAVASLLQRGVARARAEDHPGAIELFREACRLDPSAPAPRVQLVKALVQTGRDLEAIATAGHALALAREPRTRGILLTFLGTLARRQLEQTALATHAAQSATFYRQALAECPTDVVPAWNLVDLCVEAARRLGDPSWLDAGETALRELIRLAGRDDDHTARYLPAIAADARSRLAGLGPSWSHQLDALEALARSARTWSEAPAPRKRTVPWRTVFLAAALVFSLLLPFLFQWASASFAATSLSASVPSQVHATLAVVEHDWGDVAMLASQAARLGVTG